MAPGATQPTLGVLPSIGSSLADFARNGQLRRLLDYYFPAYLEEFRKIRFFSYTPEALADFTGDSDLLRRVEVVAPARAVARHRRALTLALGNQRLLRGCSVVRALHAPGALPAAIAGARYACTYGYSYVAVTHVRAPSAIAGAAYTVKRAAMRAALAQVLRRAALTIVTSVAGEREARALGAGRIELIPNGIDVEEFAPSDVEPEYDIIFVGALSRVKDVATLIRAVARVGRPLRVCIVGDGPLRNELERIAEQKGQRVDFVGNRPNAEVAATLRRSRCFVLPSVTEGQPKALLEAMAAGLACIASDLAAVEEVAPDDEVLRFPPGDEASLADRLERVLADTAEAARLGRKARATVLRRFDIRQLLPRETELLAELAQQPGSPVERSGKPHAPGR